MKSNPGMPIGGHKNQRTCRKAVPLRDEGGFTLIETLLALSIVVVMIGLVLSALRLGQRSMEKGEDALNDATARRYITERLSSDLSSMYLYSQNVDGRDRHFFKARQSAFAFVTAHHSGAASLPLGALTLVSYSVGPGGLIVTEKRTPLAEAANKRIGRTIELAPGVNRVTFTYLGGDGWKKTWDVASAKRLPMAVRAKLFFKDAGIAPLVVLAPVPASHLPFEDASSGSQGA